MSVDKTAHQFTRDAFDELIRQRFFYIQSFEIYGGACASCCGIASLLIYRDPGVGGFYDYGPPGMPNLWETD